MDSPSPTRGELATAAFAGSFVAGAAWSAIRAAGSAAFGPAFAVSGAAWWVALAVAASLGFSAFLGVAERLRLHRPPPPPEPRRPARLQFDAWRHGGHYYLTGPDADSELDVPYEAEHLGTVLASSPEDARYILSRHFADAGKPPGVADDEIA